jgi:arylsulfatase A-like enzyme
MLIQPTIALRPRESRVRRVLACTRFVTALLVLVTASFARAQTVRERPNFLLITSEDMGPDLGCYGAPDAKTPRLDALAAQGVRYTAAYANAPVCSPARTALLFGRYQTSLGASNHRSSPKLEPDARGFAGLLRDAGYFCTNGPKMDTNAEGPWQIERRTYDGNTGWWDDARGDRPFLTIRNLDVTHQSRTSVWSRDEYERKVLSQLRADEVHKPADVVVPPYYPDTPAVRQALARYANCITLMDRQAGEILDRLERDGLADDTIVMFFSDHGAGHSYHKCYGFDRGARVPLIVRVPEKWRHLTGTGADTEPGGTTDRVVSFIDVGPTILHAAGIDVPASMHGKPFLGPSAQTDRHTYTFSARDRLGENHDHVRTVMDGRYAYVRTFFPHRPYFVRFGYSFPSSIYQELVRCDEAGRLDGPAAAMFNQFRPAEALFDLANDPHETRNLAADPEYASRLAAMREALRTHMRDSRDLGLIPEAILEDRAAGEPRPRLANNASRLPLDRAHDVAMLVGMGPAALDQQLAAARDDHEAVRYWAIAGLRSQDPSDARVRESLASGLDDPSESVRTMAAGACLHAGIESDRAAGVLMTLLESTDSYHAFSEAARAAQLAGFTDDRFLRALDAANKRWNDYVPGQIAASVRRVRAGEERPAQIGFGVEAR